VVSVDEAQEICQKWLSLLSSRNNNDNDDEKDVAVVHCIDLSCRAWPVASLRELEPVFLKVRDTVHTLKFDDIIASLDTDAGLESLRYLASIFGEVNTNAPSKITTLILNDNAIGSRGVEQLRPLLQGCSISRLYFNNCGMSQEVAQLLKEMLLPRADSLQALALSRNQMGAEGAKHMGELLAACTNLESFEYAGSRPLKEGTLYLCQGLVDGGCSNLTVLDLDDSVFGDGSEDEDPVYTLCQVLKASSNLQKLILKDGALEYDGLLLVLNALVEEGAAREMLTYLDLGALCFGEDGAAKLAQVLPCMSKLTHLLLETNVLGDEGVQTLVPALTETNIQVLNLNDNEITADGFQALVDHYIPSLQKLYANDNDLEDVPEELVEQLRSTYESVILEDEDEEEEDSGTHEPATATGAAGTRTTAAEEGEVDALAGALLGAHIS
jgi:Ran GTPase-activating protein (RanGAP) involved in mRNA processing and transport